MKLPARFEETMKELLGSEAEAFFASYGQPKTTGLRINGRKLGAPAFVSRFGEPGKPIPWAEGGFYTGEDDRPGKQLAYDLGLYYIQEPSAMLPAELLDVRPGHRVLDLCAAPGGKSTQMLSKLQGRGLLVTNDNASERTKALAKNIERAGAAGTVVTNEEPERLAVTFGGFFDRVLVDAPCSGEGMFRKDESMVREWERHSVERCAAMQRDIVRQAARMVAPGGKLVYSTCTFSPLENEGTVAALLAEFPDFVVEPVRTPAEWGFGPGRPDWLNAEQTAGLDAERLATLTGAVRVWPHRSRGEGHFAAVLVRRGEAGAEPAAEEKDSSEKGQAAEEGASGEPGWTFPLLLGPANDDATLEGTARKAKGGRGSETLPKSRKGVGMQPKSERGGEAQPKKPVAPPARELRDKLLAFAEQSLPGWRPVGRLLARGERLYLLPEDAPSLDGLNAVRPGWLLGAATKHRFEPSQALAMGTRMEDAALSLRLSGSEEAALKYWKGDTLQPDPEGIVGPDGRPAGGNGWVLVCIDGFPAGWGRWDGATLKNELLPGWRRA